MSDTKGNGNLAAAIACVEKMKNTSSTSYGSKGNVKILAGLKTKKNAGDTATKPK